MTNSQTITEIADQLPHVQLADRHKNIQIQWLRATAAVMVMLFHDTVYQPASLFSVFDARFGIFAVALFFAISGYLMAIAIQRQNPFLFLAHRIIRIYPIFLIVAALYFQLTHLLKPVVHADYNALSLIPVQSADYPLSIEWTLVFEVSFYVALFFIGIVGLGKRTIWIAIAWLVYLAIVSLRHTVVPCLLSTIYTVSECAPMAAGLLIPFLVKFKFPPFFAIAIGLFCYLPVAGFLSPDPLTHRWLAAISATLILTGTIALSKQAPSYGNNRVGRLAARFGDCSYALYLVHVPVMRFMGRIAYPADLVWVASIGIAIFLAIVLGQLDVWLYGHLKRIVNRSRPINRDGLVLLFVSLYILGSGIAVYRWHEGQVAEHDAETIAGVIARQDEPLTPAQIDTIAAASGLHKSETVNASVDRVKWSNGSLIIEGWALDTSHYAPVAIAIFQGTTVLGATAVSINRSDVNKIHHIHRLTGYKVTFSTQCLGGMPIIILAVTMNGEFAIFENNQSLVCPQ